MNIFNENNGMEAGIAVAKAVNKAKVVFWNLVRIVIAVIFAIIFLLMVGMWVTNTSDGRHWSTIAWLIICALIIYRNIKKTVFESRRLNMTDIYPMPELAGTPKGEVIDAEYREVKPEKAAPKKKRSGYITCADGSKIPYSR